MDLASILLILALLILVILFITRPLFEKTSYENARNVQQKEHELSTLLAERDQILNALHELDLDHALGKIPDQDYPLQRSTMLEHGAQVLKELDKYEGMVMVVEPTRDQPAGVNAPGSPNSSWELNSMLAYQGSNGSSQPMNGNKPTFATPDDELEVMLATRRRIRLEKAVGFCPKCGHAIQKTDQFCPKCGNKL